MSKIYFQGTYGAYSHLASLSIDPKAEILPCKTFDECFLKASAEEDSRIVIPESNRITGNIGIEYLIFKYRLNIYSEYFQKIEHNLLGQPEAKIKDIKKVFQRYYKEQERGIGLGLHIVEKLCNELNIGLAIESKVDHGTKITLSFKYLKEKR